MTDAVVLDQTRSGGDVVDDVRGRKEQNVAQVQLVRSAAMGKRAVNVPPDPLPTSGLRVSTAAPAGTVKLANCGSWTIHPQ